MDSTSGTSHLSPLESKCRNARLKSKINSCGRTAPDGATACREKTQTPSSSGASTGMQRIVAFVASLIATSVSTVPSQWAEDEAALLVEHPLELLPRVDLRNHRLAEGQRLFIDILLNLGHQPLDASPQALPAERSAFSSVSRRTSSIVPFSRSRRRPSPAARARP